MSEANLFSMWFFSLVTAVVITILWQLGSIARAKTASQREEETLALVLDSIKQLQQEQAKLSKDVVDIKQHRR